MATERFAERVDAQGRRFIDMTPTWREILPLLLAGYENGNAKGRAIAFEELCRLANIADSFMAADKAKAEIEAAR